MVTTRFTSSSTETAAIKSYNLCVLNLLFWLWSEKRMKTLQVWSSSVLRFNMTNLLY